MAASGPSPATVDYAKLAPTFHGARALTAAATAAAVALAGVSWHRTGLWLAAALLLATALDAVRRRRDPEASPAPRLVVDGAVLALAAYLIGGPVLIAAPFAYLVTASLLVLPLRRAFLILAYLGVLVGSVYFSAIYHTGGRERLFLSLAAVVVFLGALGVLLVAAGRTIRTMRHAQEHLLREAREAARLKTDFLAAVSHELRTPLAGVLGFAQLLRDDTGEISEAERRAFVISIAQEAFDLAGVVEDLLVAARSQLGKLSVIEVPVSPRAQVAQVLEGWDPEDLAVRRVEIVGSSPKVLGDPARLRQVLRNLLSNALRHGGEAVRVSFSTEDGAVRIRIADDGRGIPIDRREAIFAPFYYLSHEGDSQPSVGLGLSVARQLTRLMRGDLSYGRQDGWSVFELTLPVAEGGEDPVAPAPVSRGRGSQQGAEWQLTELT